ncbi:MAG TPA: hypothetical protein VK973_10720 [Arenicellales bacterium]|nr:hypothetical protein [Arenicellales bacterium]
MEDLPIPASNMYKHVALSGVAIVLVTLVFAVSELFDIHDQILEAEERVEVMTARLEAGRNPGGDEPATELEQTLNRIRLDAASKRLDTLRDRSLELREWSTILFTIGIAVSAFGFTRWYRKIQMPMEQVAQRRAEQHVTRADTEQ